MPLERRPTALVKHIRRIDAIRLVRIHDDQICEIAFTNIAAVGNAKQISRCVTGAIDQQFQSDLLSFDQLKQGLHNVLHERQSSGRFEVAIVLLSPGMWRMIRRNDVEATIVQRCKQRLSVCARLDRRITLDARTKLVVTRLIEIELVYANPTRNTFRRTLCRLTQLHFYRRCEVQNVQQRVVAAR
jgi:hypothetical protein